MATTTTGSPILRSSNSEIFMESYVMQENENLAKLTNKPKASLMELAEKLPPDARSVLYEREYYDQYLNITITTLQSILRNYKVCLMRHPLFMYCDMDNMNGWLYALIFRFDSNQWDSSNHDETLLHTKVTDRGIQVPTWVIILRQQLVFTAALPMEQGSGDNSWCVLIDFRRIPPPFWVEQKKVSHLLDATLQVQSIIEEQYASMVDSLQKESNQLNANTSSSTPVIVNTTLPVAAPPPQSEKKAAFKQAKLSDLFGKLQKQKPPPPKGEEVDAMDIDDEIPPVSPKQPSLVEKAMMELSTYRDAEAYLIQPFMDFFSLESLQSYNKTAFYHDYQQYLDKVLTILKEKAPTNKKVDFFHQLITECRHTKSSVYFKDATKNEEHYCLLANTVLHESKLCQVVFPQSQQSLYVSKNKISLLQTIALSAYILDQVIREKTEFILANPSANKNQLDKIGEQWQKQFIMSLRILSTLIEQSCAK